MNLEITGRHVNVSDRFKEYAEKKVSRVEKYFNQIISIQVIIFQEKTEKVVEIIINADGAKFYGSERSENYFSCVDTLIDKIDQQIKKHKEKIQSHKSKGAFLPIVDFNADGHEALELLEASSKPLDFKEAYLEMQLEKRDFLLYKKDNSDIDYANRNYALLYRSGDEHFHLEVPDEMISSRDFNGAFSLSRLKVLNDSATAPDISLEPLECTIEAHNLNQAISVVEKNGQTFYPFFNTESESINVLKKLSNGFQIAVPAS